MISIAVMNIKGGVGKTTSVVNLASCFSQIKKKRVLVVDCDLQANATAYLLLNQFRDEDDVQHLPKIAKIYDFLEDEPINPTKIIFEKRKVKIEMGLIGSDENIPLLNISGIDAFAKKLKHLEDEYDYCFFDCPAELSDVALAAIYASDYVIVPSEPDTDSLKGYSLFVDAVNKIRTSTDSNVKILGVFFNKVITNDALQIVIMNNLRKGMGEELMNSTVAQAALVRQCRYVGVPVYFEKPRAKVAQDYKALTLELFKRMKSK